MSVKKTLDESLNVEGVKQAESLCITTLELINHFREDIYYKDSNQLFEQKYVELLLEIAMKIDQLNFNILKLMKPRNHDYGSLRTALAAINSAPNSLIITAHYLNPNQLYKRLLNKNTFCIELNRVIKCIDFVRQILKRLASGRISNRAIPRPYIGFRAR